MGEQNNQDDKRRLHTLFDPKMLQIFIPLLLAVGSGFLVHDRSISNLNVTVMQHERTIASLTEFHNTTIVGLRESQKDIESLLSRLSSYRGDQRQLERILQDMQRVVVTLEQRSIQHEDTLRELKQQIRELERR
jgi:septal ring factor EnvC (AmiA/AmiB activator)